jgi:hypothetical protein
VYPVLVSGETAKFERLSPCICERTYVKPLDPRRLAADIQALLSRAA